MAVGSTNSKSSLENEQNIYHVFFCYAVQCYNISLKTTSFFLKFISRHTSLQLLLKLWNKIQHKNDYKYENQILQSQFRFDNECYLNLPDNHKRVSLTPQISYDVNTDAPAINDGKDDDTGSVLARTSNAAIIAKESNFNLVYDDFNVASVSMLFLI